MKIFPCHKGVYFILTVLLCLGYLLPSASFAQGKICGSLFLESDHDVLVRAYELYLKERNEDISKIPKTVLFKGQTYKVIEHLGGGLEGIAVRVEDSQGNRSIMKIFLNPMRHILRQAWDYYKMNKDEKYPYTVIAMDYKNKIFQFQDIRGLPMNRIGERLEKMGAPQKLIRSIYGQVAMEGYHYYDQNVLYDIDRRVFVAIDPH